MASSYTTLLRLEQQASGENSNTWGTKENTKATLVEEAICGLEEVAVTGAGTTLTTNNGSSDQARNAILKFTGTLASNETVTVPSLSKTWVVWNATSGDYTLSLETSGGTPVTVKQGEVAFLFCDGSEVYEVMSDVMKQGTHTIWVPAQAMRPAQTNGCGNLAVVEISANQPEVLGLPFDASSEEYATFAVPLPKSWNSGTVTFKPFWTANSVATDDVIWGLQGVSLADNDAIGSAYGTAQTVTDTHNGATYDMNVGADSSEITIAGSPGDNEMQYFRVYRDADDASDDLAVDAYLLGIQLSITTNAANDE